MELKREQLEDILEKLSKHQFDRFVGDNNSSIYVCKDCRCGDSHPKSEHYENCPYLKVIKSIHEEIAALEKEKAGS